MDSYRNEMLGRWRKMLADDRHALGVWREGKLWSRTNGVDTTAETIAMFERRVADMERLIARVEAGEI